MPPFLHFAICHFINNLLYLFGMSIDDESFDIGDRLTHLDGVRERLPIEENEEPQLKSFYQTFPRS